MSTNKGDCALFDRGSDALSCARPQAGFVTWASLAILVALSSIAGVGITTWQWITVVSKEQQFECAVVRVSKNVPVINSAKEHIPHIGVSLARERGKFSRVFHQLPLKIQLLVGIALGVLACVFYGFGFWFLDRRRFIYGGGLLLLGFLIFLCDGFIVTGFL